MPRQKSGTFDQNEYNKEYQRNNIKYRKINFNVNSEDDARIMDWLDGRQEPVSNYLKRLIVEDMARQAE